MVYVTALQKCTTVYIVLIQICQNNFDRFSYFPIVHFWCYKKKTEFFGQKYCAYKHIAAGVTAFIYIYFYMYYKLHRYHVPVYSIFCTIIVFSLTAFFQFWHIHRKENIIFDVCLPIPNTDPYLPGIEKKIELIKADVSNIFMSIEQWK